MAGDSYDDFLTEAGGGGGGGGTATDDDSYAEFLRQQRQEKLAKERAAQRAPQTPVPAPAASPGFDLSRFGLTPLPAGAPASVAPAPPPLVNASRTMIPPIAQPDVTATPALDAGIPNLRTRLAIEHESPSSFGEMMDYPGAAAAGALRGVTSFAVDQAQMLRHPVAAVEALGKAAVTAPYRAAHGIGGMESSALERLGIPLPVDAQFGPSASEAAGGLFDTALLTEPAVGAIGKGLAMGRDAMYTAAAGEARYQSALERAQADAMAARARKGAAGAPRPADGAPLALPSGQYDLGPASFQSRDVPETDPARLLPPRAIGAGVPTEGPAVTAPIGMPAVDWQSPLDATKAAAAEASTARQQALGLPRALLAPSVEEQEGAARAAETSGVNRELRASPEEVDTYRLTRDAGISPSMREIGRPTQLPGETDAAYAARVANRVNVRDRAIEQSSIAAADMNPAQQEAAARAKGQLASVRTASGTARSIDMFPKMTDDALHAHMADLLDNQLGAQHGAVQANQAARLNAAEAELEARGHSMDDIWTTGLERGRSLNAATAEAKITPSEPFGFTAAGPLAMIVGTGVGAAAGAALAPAGHRGEGAAAGALSALGLTTLGVSIARDGRVAEAARGAMGDFLSDDAVPPASAGTRGVDPMDMLKRPFRVSDEGLAASERLARPRVVYPETGNEADRLGPPTAAELQAYRAKGGDTRPVTDADVAAARDRYQQRIAQPRAGAVGDQPTPRRGRKVTDAVVDETLQHLTNSREGADALEQLLGEIDPSGDMDEDLRRATRRYLERGGGPRPRTGAIGDQPDAAGAAAKPWQQVRAEALGEPVKQVTPKTEPEEKLPVIPVEHTPQTVRAAADALPREAEHDATREILGGVAQSMETSARSGEPMTARDALDDREENDSARDMAHTPEQYDAARKVLTDARPAAPAQDFPHQFASTQLNLPEATAAKVKALGATIPETDLAGDGRETQPHVTVKFGLHGNDPEPLRSLLADEKPITVTMGKTSAFKGVEGGTADAVKVDVNSPELHALNKKIADAMPNSDAHPEYVPHATVAYVKPGLGEKYSGSSVLEGHEVTVDHVTFSGRDGKQIDLPLGGESTPRRGAADPKLIKTLGLAALGAGVGGLTGDTPGEHLRNAALGLTLGGGAGAALSREAKALSAGEKAELGAAATMERPAAGAKEAADAITATFAPQTRGELAATTGQVVRAARGKIEREAAVAQQTLDRVSAQYKKLPIGKKLGFMDAIEAGRTQADKALQPLANTVRRLLDEERDRIRGMGTGKLDHFIENYFPHLWQDEDRAGQWLTKILGKRPMGGSKSFLKQRTIPTVLEGMFPQGVPKNLESMTNAEILAENRRQGGLVPVTFNPVEATMLKLREMKKYRMAQEVIGDLGERGLLQAIPESGRLPVGYARVGDWAFAGKAAPEPVARVLNNYLSPGLRGNAAYDAYMAIGNTLNQAQLGFSAFHAGMTTIETMVSQNALALEHLVQGKAGQALKEFATFPAAPFRNYQRGEALRRGYLSAPGTISGPIAAIADGAAEAGARYRMDVHSQASTAFSNALEAKQYARAAKQLLPAMMEKVMGPVMNELVPRQKMGIFYDLAESELARLGPEAHPDEVTRAMQRAWDSVDNRMGQVVYDNLFWNKTAKDLFHASVRSVGWNWGTFNELGGGTKDLAGFVKDLATPGKASALSHRAAYALALPMTLGMLGAVTQYLYTGTGPESMFDMFHPKTGTKDADGNDNRVVLPSYMKDVYGFGQHPVKTITNKMNPLLSLVADGLMNKDFYGDQIYDSPDFHTSFMQSLLSSAKAAGQLARYGAKATIPFGVENIIEDKKRGAGASEKALAFVGITPASREAVRSRAQNLMHDALARRAPQLTPEEANAAKVRADLRDKVRTQGAPAAMAELRAHLRDGTLTMKQVQNMLQDDQTPALVKHFKQLTLADAERVYRASTSDREKKLWLPILQGKRARAGQ